MMKVLKITALALFLIFVCIEGYWCFSHRGNLILYFQNQAEMNEVIEVKISLDKDVIFSGKLVSGEIIPHSLNLFKSIGQHDLWILRGDTNEVIHAKFSLFLVKWIVIDIYPDSVNINYEFIPPLFQ